jgi:hypothetical protein
MDFGKVGFVLPGGGAKCSGQAGNLLALEELGIKSSIQQGISGGALNVARVVESGAQALINDWKFFEQKKYSFVFSKLKAATSFWGGASLYGDKGLWIMVQRVTDPSAIIKSQIIVEIVVQDHEIERPRIIKAQDCHDTFIGRNNFLKFIKASASFPGLFPPVEINGQLYSDGYSCILDSFSLCDTIFFLDSGQPRQIGQRIKRWNYHLMKSVVELIDSRVEEEIIRFINKNSFKIFPRGADAYNTIIWKNIWEKTKDSGIEGGKKFIFVAPTLIIPGLRLDRFRDGDLSRLIDHGYERAREIVTKLI